MATKSVAVEVATWRFDPTEYVPVDTETDAGQQVVDQIMAATNVDDVDSESTVVPMKDLTNTTFTIRGARFIESDYDQGAKAYAVCACVNEDGEEFLATIGATNCLAQLVKYNQMSAFPRKVRLISKKTRANFEVFRFVRVEAEKPF